MIAEIFNLAVVPSISASLDPLPKWIIEKLKRVSAPILCSLCNSSLSNGVMPASQKHAIVIRRVKKSRLDPTSLSSYRPISNLSFSFPFTYLLARTEEWSSHWLLAML